MTDKIVYHVESRLHETEDWEFHEELSTLDKANELLAKLYKEDVEFQPEDYFTYRVVMIDKTELYTVTREKDA